jgi:hypothetical protein
MRIVQSQKNNEYFLRKIGSLPNELRVEFKQRIPIPELDQRGIQVGAFWTEIGNSKGRELMDCISMKVPCA